MKNVIIFKIGTNQFVCVFCEKVFTRKWNLKIHLRIHNGINRVIVSYVPLTPILFRGDKHSTVSFATQDSHNRVSLTPIIERTQVQSLSKFVAQFYSSS